LTATLLYAVSRLPAGQRKTELSRVIGQILDEDFRDRTEPFTRQAVTRYTPDFVGTGIRLIDPWIADR
jgi:hypothetical protein